VGTKLQTIRARLRQLRQAPASLQMTADSQLYRGVEAFKPLGLS
jgi:hypothetical protein